MLFTLLLTVGLASGIISGSKIIEEEQLLPIEQALIVSSAIKQAKPVAPTIVYPNRDDNMVGCLVNIDGSIFNLLSLRKEIPVQRELAVSYQVNYQDATGTNSIEFNICGMNARQCPDLQDDYANLINAYGTCDHLSSPIVHKKQAPGQYQLIDPQYPEQGIKITYLNGNKCTDTQFYELSINLNCNQ